MGKMQQDTSQGVGGGRVGDAVALVVGLSSNGLSIARALSREGIAVHALEEAGANPIACRTRAARVQTRQGVYGEGLVDHLLEVRRQFPEDRAVVLYLCSDRMVKQIGAAWDRLSGHYRLGWSSCPGLVLELLRKDSLAAHCSRLGIPYPESRVIEGPEDCQEACPGLEFPVVVKPARPLSSFKAIKAESIEDVRAIARKYAEDSPFVVQHWIEGGERELYFATLYADRGRPLAEFTGRKIESVPASMGIGSVVESADCPEALELARRFVAGVGISGPVAVEFKRDSSGRYWMIEPNVGRMESSVDLVIQSGVNLPLVEFRHALGQEADGVAWPRQEVVFFDTERDPLAYTRACVREGTLRPYGKQPVFPHLGHGDWGPLWAAAGDRVTRVGRRLGRTLGLGRGV